MDQPTTWSISEVRPRVFRIDTPLGGRIISIYVIRGDDASLMFDTGVVGTIPDYVVPALESVGIVPSDIRTVMISHCDADHFGGIRDVRAYLPHAQIFAHAEDRHAIEDYATFVRERADGFAADWARAEDPDVLEWIRSVVGEGPLDGQVGEGDVFDLGGISVVVWHVPGHTTGHLALHLPGLSTVALADAVLGLSVNLADGTPAFPPTYRFVEPYRDTIARFQRENHSMILTAHYPTMEGTAAARFLSESVAFVDRLEHLVSEHIAASSAGSSLPELLRELNPIAGDWPAEGTEGALAYPVVGHLEDLERRGRIRRSGPVDGQIRWVTA